MLIAGDSPFLFHCTSGELRRLAATVWRGPAVISRRAPRAHLTRADSRELARRAASMGLPPPAPPRTEPSASATASTGAFTTVSAGPGPERRVRVCDLHVHDRAGSCNRGPDDTLTTVGSVTLDNSTAQIGTVKNYITVLMPDVAADGKAAARLAGHDLTVLTLKAAAVATKQEKLGRMLSTERKAPAPSCLRGSQSLALGPHQRWPRVALAVAALGATIALLLVYLLALRRQEPPTPPSTSTSSQPVEDTIHFLLVLYHHLSPEW
ncbi:Histone acetyltransferase KAT6A [Frankliniella fusca]|uniref:Histone acetyltransferase KAT6A n=1 Tax=Frankliniella fusca TaxID=407009 RepID=A0AAE1H122_9NEOP|nr:Histone acetyltransferase KAT6A [Frankliniella fusca]